jgi:hypothetical protein
MTSGFTNVMMEVFCFGISKWNYENQNANQSKQNLAEIGMPTVLERIEKLEEEIRAFDHSTQKGYQLDASKLVLRDPNGIERVRLEANSDGASLLFLGSNGKQRIQLKLTSDECLMSILDEDENPRVGIGLGSKGPALTIADQKTERLWLRVGDDGAIFTIVDSNGNPRIGAGSMKDDETAFFIGDAEGRPRGGFGVSGNSSFMRLDDADGNVVFRQPE